MSQTAPSYAERHAWNHGTVTERMGKDSVTAFDDCNLTLRRAVDPVVTPGGILYSREAIVGSLLTQKQVNKQRQLAYETYLAKKDRETERLEHERNLEALAMYSKQMGASDTAIERLKSESTKAYKDGTGGKQLVASVKSIKSEAKKLESLKSYWTPGHERSDGKSEAERIMERPDLTTRCPATRNPLKLKDLISVRFQKNKDGECVDPVTLRALSNASRLVVLRDVREGPNVLSRSTYERLVRPEGQYNGTPIDDELGVIDLQIGGTGFAATNKLEASKHFAIGSALQRGRAAGRSGGSSGLQFGN